MPTNFSLYISPEIKKRLLILVSEKQKRENRPVSMTEIISRLINQAYFYFERNNCMHEWLNDGWGHGDNEHHAIVCPKCGKVVEE